MISLTKIDREGKHYTYIRRKKYDKTCAVTHAIIITACRSMQNVYQLCYDYKRTMEPMIWDRYQELGDIQKREHILHSSFR